MTKEYAALLAQVIPVVALAIAIEARALAKRSAELYLVRDEKTDGSHQGVGVLLMAMAQIVLTVGEVRALAVVRGPVLTSEDWLSAALVVGIACAFLVPVGESVLRVFFAGDPRRGEPGRRTRWRVGAALVFFAALVGVEKLLS
ncbi:hypothetical protein [Nonomuraea lactucae]|uniref:hypothetical protein n=1 Tax=Nonomuraea lactucae TaxID=2249762 RepID=UPI0013B42066|nr:hypothetical protein [Nonomuraea lactucae]